MASENEWYLEAVDEAVNTFCKLLNDKIEKEQQQLKACKKNTELETKIACEMNTNVELTNRLAELSRRSNELDRVCSSLESGLKITDNDQSRLDKAKEEYEVGKDLTGVRFDYSAPPHLVKGYVKSKVHKKLQSFEFEATDHTEERLWAVIADVTGQADENKPNNV